LLLGLTVAFDLLSKESSKNGKEAILRDKKNVNDNNFLEVLKFVYNPFVVTGISTKKINKKVKVPTKANVEDLEMFPDITKLMNYLKKKNTGTDYDLYVVHEFLNHCRTDKERKLIKDIVTKNLKVGITEKTVNKVYGKGTIPSFGVMLAEAYEKKESKVNGKFHLTIKIDGNRCVAIKDNDEVKFFSRKGQEIEGLNDLASQFKLLPNNYVFDGELLLKNDDNLPSDKLFRATQKIVRKDGEKKDLEFYMFDALPLSDFKCGESKKTYEQRRNTMDVIFEQKLVSIKEKRLIWILPVLYAGEDKKVISLFMTKVEKEGFEGLMLNISSEKYVTKRTSALLKIKTFNTFDGVIMGVYEGTGKNEGKLGGIVITYKDLLVRVGSGFSDKERKLYWNNPDEIIGRVGEVSYFEESENQKGGKDLRFATWKGLRLDKGVDDVNYDS
jgi:DNA ligase-1